MNGYPEWHQDYTARVSVDVAIEGLDVPNFRLGTMDQQRTGRVRIVIEGEKELVEQLLGKNWLERCRRVTAEVKK